MTTPIPTYHYRCSRCGREYPGDRLRYTCPHDGGNLDIILDYDALRRELSPSTFPGPGAEPSLWRYQALLPVPDPGGHGTPLRRVGWTPIYALPRLRARLGLPHLWFKDESPNPTASFKDRASAIVLAHARQQGADVVITASTGNAGAALAGLAAASGQRAVILAPATAPRAKIAQLLIYGARVVLIEGTYDDAFDLSVQAAQALGWYCRNTGYNPFTAEGKKTAAFEMWEQLLRDAPDARWHIFIPVGDGNIISGIYKGFWDLHQLGWLPQMPRLHGVQAEGSAAVARAFFAGADRITPVQAQTLADSISVNLPRDGERALRAVRATGGRYWVVSDDAILAAMRELGHHGVFVEPAAAAAYAGLRAAQAEAAFEPTDRVIVLLTGSGLKDVAAAMQAVPPAPQIPPDLDALQRVLAAAHDA
ncbi:MAG: threonine synthase [Chloroflexi bacterium]|nr:threonine synthase [Chloroflexota bacterium]